MKAQGWAIFVLVFLVLFIGVGSFLPSDAAYFAGVKGIVSLFIAWQATKRFRGQEASSSGGNIIMDEVSDPTVENEDTDWGDEELFDWILQLENITQALSASSGCPAYLLEATLKLRSSMVERLYATGGHYAEIHRKGQGL